MICISHSGCGVGWSLSHRQGHLGCTTQTAGLGQLEKRSPRWGLKPEAASQQWATICVSSTLESWLRLLPLKKTLDDKGREDASAAGPHPGVLVAVPLWPEPLPGQAGNPQAYLAKTKGCTNIGASESARGATHSP